MPVPIEKFTFDNKYKLYQHITQPAWSISDASLRHLIQRLKEGWFANIWEVSQETD